MTVIAIFVLGLFFILFVYALVTDRSCPYRYSGKRFMCEDCPLLGPYCDDSRYAELKKRDTDG
jgi:hypothetical protein